MCRTPWVLAALLVAASVTTTTAQDVEMLGRRFGTRPPGAYYEAMRRDPSAFEFRRGRSERRLEAPSFGARSFRAGGPELALGPRTGPVEGIYSIPVILGLYSNSPSNPPFAQTEIQDGYFGSAPGTITNYYTEVSGGKVTLIGDVFDWVQVARQDTAYTVGESGLVSGSLGGGGAGNFVYELLDLQIGIDWGQYDNDGPDGVPNSGDDDGYVDVVAVVHPTSGGECRESGSEDRIWSHRWSLSSAVSITTGSVGMSVTTEGYVRNSGSFLNDGFRAGMEVLASEFGLSNNGLKTITGVAARLLSVEGTVTDTLRTATRLTANGSYITANSSANGGLIRVDDYIIQPSVACSDGDLNPIGVFTHELGHAFGLPDLYDTNETNGKHAGAGIWDLMASGSWGCNNASPSKPCHMGAWSKSMLGWVDVITLAPDTDHGMLTLPPVETAATVYRVDASDGSGEYFLLENRQRIGSDVNLYSEGLLVWQIDPDWVSARWGGPLSSNGVNADEHMGVWLRQADGNDDLGSAGGGRGDAGDPFPGVSGNTAFHAVSNPGAISYGGGFTGLTVFDITRVGDDVRFGLATRFATLTVRADGAAGTTGIFTVNGASVDPPATTFVSAPFVEHTIEAIAGEPIQPGERRPFLDWLDDAAAPRTRGVVTPGSDVEYVARYGGTQFELAIVLTGGVNGVVPATFVSQPASEDLWFSSGISGAVEAVPQTGFEFVAWGGALIGQQNPASFTMATPLAASADFTIVYAITSTVVELPAATSVDVQLEVENGTPPYNWTVVAGSLPPGLALNGSGRITGAATEVGVFDLTLQAVDGIGLPATAPVSLNLVDPEIAIEALASPFLLTGVTLSAAQRTLLNVQGNGVGSYDIGDFRAWVLAHPSLPLSAGIQAVLVPTTVVIRMEPDSPAGGVRR
jgi:hypothetical protein